MSKNPKPLVERASRAAFWNVAFFPLKLLLPFVAGIVTVRLLRNEGYALLSVATALLNQFGLVADLGIERTLPRFYPEIEMRYGRRGIVQLLLWVGLVKGVVLGLLILALAVAPDFWIDSFKLGDYGGLLLMMVGALLVLGALSDVSIQLLYTHFRQKVTNSLDVLAVVVSPVLTAGFVLAGSGPVGAVFALLVTTLISVCLSLWQAWRMLRHMDLEPHPRAASVKLPSTRSLRRRLISFAGLNYLINWTAALYDRPFLVLAIGLLIVSPPESRAAIAILTLSYNFVKQFLRALVVPLTGVQTPLFARLYAEGRIEGLRTAYATITKFLVLALLPSALGLIFTSRNLLQLFFGQVGSDAVLTQSKLPEVVTCTVILAVGLFGEAMISVTLSVLMVYEDYRAVITARLAALISIPMLLLLAPSLGAVGASLAAASAGLVSRLVALLYAERRIGLRFPGAFFVRVGVASAVMSAALLPFLVYLPPDWPETILMIGTGVVVFYVAFRLLGGMDAEDKARFAGLRVPVLDRVLRYL